MSANLTCGYCHEPADVVLIPTQDNPLPEGRCSSCIDTDRDRVTVGHTDAAKVVFQAWTNLDTIVDIATSDFVGRTIGALYIAAHPNLTQEV